MSPETFASVSNNDAPSRACREATTSPRENKRARFTPSKQVYFNFMVREDLLLPASHKRETRKSHLRCRKKAWKRGMRQELPPTNYPRITPGNATGKRVHFKEELVEQVVELPPSAGDDNLAAARRCARKQWPGATPYLNENWPLQLLHQFQMEDVEYDYDYVEQPVYMDDDWTLGWYHKCAGTDDLEKVDDWHKWWRRIKTERPRAAHNIYQLPPVYVEKCRKRLLI